MAFSYCGSSLLMVPSAPPRPHVQLMCQWLMKTDNAVECGVQCEVFSHGMLRAYFSPDNRIKRLEIVFDVMSFMQQLQRAVGRGEFRMVPNTVRVLKRG